MRYKFRYFGTNKTTGKIAGAIVNFWLPLIIFYILYFLIDKLTLLIGMENYLSNDAVFHNLLRITLICSISSVIVFCLFRKGVFLNEDNLIIARYTITPYNWKWWMKIDYCDIEKVNVNYFDLNYADYNYRMLNSGGDRNYNIELTLKNGKRYYFSIEDQEEFCENLNLLLEKNNMR